jgi:hypothetical protein
MGWGAGRRNPDATRPNKEDDVTTDEFMRLLPLLAPLIAIQLVLLAAALIDLIRRPRTRGPKWAWGLAIAFISIFGPLAYFLFGRSDE